MIDRNASIPNDCQNEIVPKPNTVGINQFHNHINGYAMIITISASIANPPRKRPKIFISFMV